MTLDEYNAFCASLPHTAHVVQWGGAHVWKVGGASGKVFAIGGWDEGDELFVTFKCSPMSFELLKSEPGCRPAPYLASRGMPWIQRHRTEFLDDNGLKAYLTESHRLAALNLAKKLRLELGLA
jgi:predicted DNA-binding protein (MmcQ/YjbR family)